MRLPCPWDFIQARILEWVAMPSSRGCSLPRDQTCEWGLFLKERKLSHPLGWLKNLLFHSNNENYLLKLSGSKLSSFLFFYKYSVWIMYLAIQVARFRTFFAEEHQQAPVYHLTFSEMCNIAKLSKPFPFRLHLYVLTGIAQQGKISTRVPTCKDDAWKPSQNFYLKDFNS